MAHEPPSWPALLAGTVLLRPYVFVFLAAFLVLAGRDPGSKLEKAKELGVPVIDESALRAML